MLLTSGPEPVAKSTELNPGVSSTPGIFGPVNSTGSPVSGFLNSTGFTSKSKSMSAVSDTGPQAEN